MKDEIKNQGGEPQKGQLFLVVKDWDGGNDQDKYGWPNSLKGKIVGFIGHSTEIDPAGISIGPNDYLVLDEFGSEWHWDKRGLLEIKDELAQELYGVTDEDRFGS